MKNFLQKTIIIILLFAGFTASAQTPKGVVTGKALNTKDKTAIEYATAVVRKLTGDTAIVGSGLTGQNGVFKIDDLPNGKYKVTVAFLGLRSIVKEFELNSAQPGINLGDLLMDDTGVDLQAVVIKGDIPPVKVKKDTLEFNAAAFKVKENAVVEDVLKKLPGVEVAKDGSITAQGETIKKVRVDGKDFMGSDPLLATRNLPADMVDKIQIIDDLSEQSKFSGVDDGNREKIINITTRQDKKKGTFGNSTLGYGTDDRYEVNLNINRFDKDQQMSVIGQFNNVNKQNFGGGGGGGRGGFGGGGPQKGITTTNLAGFNYANVFKGGTTFNASYNFNKTSLFNKDNSFTTNLLGTDVTTSSSNSESTSDRMNHRFNATLDTKIDSTVSLRWQPNFTYSDNEGVSLNKYERNVLTNNTKGTQGYNTNSTSPSLNNNLLLRKKFQRRGRTLSLNISTNYNNTDGNNFNKINEVASIAGVPRLTNTNQLNDQDSKSINNTVRLVYTEPLSKTLNLELNYQNGYSFDNQDKAVYDFNTVTGNYDLINASFSNNFDNTTFTNTVGFSFNKNEKKYNWQIGLGVQNTDQQRLDVTKNDKFSRNYINLTPTARYNYTFSQNKRLRINYNGRTQQPSIGQIAPILDNTNTTTLPIGNPDLKPSFTNSLQVFYNNFNFANYRSFFVGGIVTQQLNAFSTQSNVVKDPNRPQDFGKIEQKSVNVDGNFSANVFSTLSQPIIKGNKLNFTIDLRGSYAQSTGFSGTIENITHNYEFRNGYKLVSNLEKFDLIAGISGIMNIDNYSVNVNNNAKYYTLAPNIDISYVLPGNIRLQTDLTYNKLTGRGAGFDTEYTLINAYISRQFFKNKGTFKLSANDLLNQNTGVTRTSGGNTITDSNFNVLKRYYMLSFTYSLGAVASKSTTMQGMGGGMRGMH